MSGGGQSVLIMAGGLLLWLALRRRLRAAPAEDGSAG